MAAAEDFSLILAAIASISTSKRHKGFLQLSLDAGRRPSAFLSITLKVARRGRKGVLFERRGIRKCHKRICRGQNHLRNWHRHKDGTAPRVLRTPGQTGGRNEQKLAAWIGDECVRGGAVVFPSHIVKQQAFSWRHCQEKFIMMCVNTSRIFAALSQHTLRKIIIIIKQHRERSQSSASSH